MISIGELAKRANCTVPTIRYYESIGLLPKPQRRDGGHRAYDRSDLARLNLIRRCRDADIPIDRIKSLVMFSLTGKPCMETAAFFSEQRDIVRVRIAALKELELSLSLYVQSCEADCMPSGAPCAIYKDLEGVGPG